MHLDAIEFTNRHDFYEEDINRWSDLKKVFWTEQILDCSYALRTCVIRQISVYSYFFQESRFESQLDHLRCI